MYYRRVACITGMYYRYHFGSLSRVARIFARIPLSKSCGTYSAHILARILGSTYSRSYSFWHLFWGIYRFR